MKKFLSKYSIIFWIFLIGSFIGFVHENLLMFFRGRYALRQGLIYEPLIPIYGVGALLFYYTYKKIDVKSKPLVWQVIIIFLIGFIVGGAAEYACSFLQEKIFGTTSWNYAKHRFNLNGRISLKYSTIWGLLGVVFYYFVIPLFNKLNIHLQKKYLQILTICFSAILIYDSAISFLACYRQTERRNGIEASNRLECYLDEHYPDEYLGRIFNNAKVRKK